MSSVPVRLARVADRVGHRRRQRPHAAFALYRLDDDRGRPIRHRADSAVGVVGGDERHARHQRRERRAVVVVPRHRQRAHRPAVERVLERDELGALAAALRYQYRRANFRLASTASAPLLQKNARGSPGERRQPRGELPLERVEEQVRRVQQLAAPAPPPPRPGAGARARARRRRHPKSDRDSCGRWRRTGGSRGRGRTRPGPRRYTCSRCSFSIAITSVVVVIVISFPASNFRLPLGTSASGVPFDSSAGGVRRTPGLRARRRWRCRATPASSARRHAASFATMPECAVAGRRHRIDVARRRAARSAGPAGREHRPCAPATISRPASERAAESGRRACRH